jgi:hypothetical protein
MTTTRYGTRSLLRSRTTSTSAIRSRVDEPCTTPG